MWFRMPTLFQKRKATRLGAPSQAPSRSGVVEDPGMCARSLYGNREISGLTVGAGTGSRPASGRRGAEADDERTGEVRSISSSCETCEQSRATGGGVGGAKGWNRGEREPIAHATDSEPR